MFNSKIIRVLLRYSGDRKSLDEILTETVVNRKEFELTKSGSRMKKLTAAKEIYAKKAYNEGYSMEVIARHIGVSVVAVFKYINKQAQEDKLKS